MHAHLVQWFKRSHGLIFAISFPDFLMSKDA
jgi:hypothetical protein